MTSTSHDEGKKPEVITVQRMESNLHCSIVGMIYRQVLSLEWKRGVLDDERYHHHRKPARTPGRHSIDDQQGVT